MARRPGTFEIVDTDLGGRIAKLKLRTETIETPAFFPVVDPLRQEVSLNDIRKVGFTQVITNAYLAYKRWGLSVDSIHNVLGWDGAVMTDSGAYQILAYGSVDISQEEILRYQRDVLKPDIGVILDIPTGDVPYRKAVDSVEATLRRARSALEIIDPINDDILWVLPIQGGRYLDLVARSSKEASSLPYRMYGVGSPTVFLEKYKYDVIVRIVGTAKSLLPPGRPVHLFGAGHPLIIPFAVALGVDTFDSASYILYARNDRYMTPYGVYRLEELDYFPCSCPVCSRYTPKELLEMPKSERVRLLALHNLYAIYTAIKRTKQAIREGRLWEVLEELSRRHPAAARALRNLRRSFKLLEAHTPRVKPRFRGLRAYGRESLWNPKLVLFKQRIQEFLPKFFERMRSRGYRSIRLRPAKRLPEDCASGNRQDELILYYAPFVGVVPIQLCGVYPSIHVDYADVDVLVAREVADALAATVSKAWRAGLNPIIELDDTLTSFFIMKKFGSINGRSGIRLVRRA